MILLKIVLENADKIVECLESPSLSQSEGVARLHAIYKSYLINRNNTINHEDYT